MFTCTPAAITTKTVCPKCGTIAISGKTSCCGQGGSWFKNCGSAGNTNVHHTWYEGIQACKARAQDKAAIDQNAHAAQRKGDNSADASPMANIITSTPSNMSTAVMLDTFSNMFMNTPSHPSVSTSNTVQGCEKLLGITVYVSLLLVIVFQC